MNEGLKYNIPNVPLKPVKILIDCGSNIDWNQLEEATDVYWRGEISLQNLQCILARTGRMRSLHISNEHCETDVDFCNTTLIPPRIVGLGLAKLSLTNFTTNRIEHYWLLQNVRFSSVESISLSATELDYDLREMWTDVVTSHNNCIKSLTVPVRLADSIISRSTKALKCIERLSLEVIDGFGINLNSIIRTDFCSQLPNLQVFISGLGHIALFNVSRLLYCRKLDELEVVIDVPVGLKVFKIVSLFNPARHAPTILVLKFVTRDKTFFIDRNETDGKFKKLAVQLQLIT